MAQPSFPRSSSDGTPREGRLQRRHTIQLSLSAIITSVIVLVIGLGWVFAFGVIVGRGYNPEKELPGMAVLLPAPRSEAAPEPEILKPEELTFMNDLKQRPSVGADPGPQSAPHRPSRPSTAVPNVPASSAHAPAPGPDAEMQYDFVFQIVAYKNSGQADTLRERLEEQGMRTRMTIERNSAGKPKWYRVQVLFKGTEADAAGVKSRLAGMGLKDVIQASRKPAAGSR